MELHEDRILNATPINPTLTRLAEATNAVRDEVSERLTRLHVDLEQVAELAEAGALLLTEVDLQAARMAAQDFVRRIEAEEQRRDRVVVRVVRGAASAMIDDGPRD